MRNESETPSHPFQLRLRKFDITRFATNSATAFVIGARRRGKTTLLKDILFQMRDRPYGTVVSATEESARVYASHVPPAFIFNEYTPDIPANIVRHQNQLIDQQKNTGSEDDIRSFLMMDDWALDTSWTRDSNMQTLFNNGKNLKTSTVLTWQEPVGVSPVIRGQVDFTFIFGDSREANRRLLYEKWAPMFPDFDSFNQVFEQCTANYECLVIDNTVSSNNVEDKVFWYKAGVHPEFRACAPEYWVADAPVAPVGIAERI